MSDEMELKEEMEEKVVAEKSLDSDIETMTVEEMASKEEEPKKTSSQKREVAAKKLRKGRKHKGIIILLIILAIGIYIYSGIHKAKKAIEDALNEQSTEYALIERQDIRDAISTTGTIVSKKTSQLYSALKDTKITNVNYEVGDHVTEGDVVVTFSTENIEKNIANKKEDIAYNRQLAAIKAEDRERNYLNSYGDVSYDLQTANENVDTMLKRLYEACDAYGDAKRELEKYRNDEEYRNENPGIEGTLQSKVSQAYQQEQEAQKNYSDAVASLANSNRKSTNNLSAADSSKESAEIEANQSARKDQRDLESYEDSLVDYIVTAPISGIVTKVEIEEGNGFSGGNLMTIQQDDVLDITTEIDEFDIPSVEKGQRVIIKTDATGDDELEGVVTMISPTATTSSNASATQSSSSGVTYTVKIEIQTKDERLRLGMSAKINIILDEHLKTTVVRYDAIEEDDDGRFYVRVVDNNGVAAENAANGDSGSAAAQSIAVVGVDGKENAGDKKVPGFKLFKKEEAPTQEVNSRNIYITKGIEGDYYTEILSDEIKEGMQVLVTSKEWKNDDPFAMMMGP